MIGRTFGPYRILDRIGAGGMGVVFRALDTRLQRDVAVKVLPEIFAADPERLARFEREARVVASLNHPNVAAVYDVFHAGEVHFLVMELVPGEDLAAQIERQPLPLPEALRIARDVAAALEQAHEQGIVHRDLKPGNVKVTPEERVKVLDFGLAKAFESPAAAGLDLSHSPTVVAPLSGAAGIILGTAAYMSPEQARGKPVDRRTDIWAFGCLIYECLTGRRAFPGETASDTIARILEREPDWSVLGPGTPPRLERLLRLCLRKDPRERLRDIGDARLEIEEILSGGGEIPATPAEQPPRPRRWSGAPAGIAIGLVLGLAAAIPLVRMVRNPPPPEPAARYGLLPSPNASFHAAWGGKFIFSADDRSLLFTGMREGQPMLFRRLLDGDAALPVAGTEGGAWPVESPDGKWVAVIAAGELRKVPAAGGAPVVMAKIPAVWGAAWHPDGSILCSPAVQGGLVRIPGSGGDVETLTTPRAAEGEFAHWWPFVLPGGRHVLYTCWRSTIEDASINALDLKTGESREILRGGGQALYVPTGHLVYGRTGTLMAVPFDPDRLELLGEPVAVVDSVQVSPSDGGTLASFSRDGTLLYLAQTGVVDRRIVWVERLGDGTVHVDPIPGARGPFRSMSLSPDGRRLALERRDNRGGDLWVLDAGRGVLSPLTTDGTNGHPIWSADGTHLYFQTLRSGPYNIHRIRADGSGGDERVIERGTDLDALSLSADGLRLLMTAEAPATRSDLWIHDFATGKATPFASSAGRDEAGSFSPDGRWIAYHAEVAGRLQIILQPVDGGARIQVSARGGESPHWSPDGRHLFYLWDGVLYRVAVDPDAEGVIGNPEPWIRETEDLRARILDTAVHPDGRRLAMILADAQVAEEAPRVIVNWFEELKRKAPGR